eukprot:11163512-Lingulodinium_polyedra.AAC.1
MRAWSARARAICEVLRPRTVNSTTLLCSVLETLHNDAIESTVRCRSGSRIARSCTPRARQQSGPCLE